MTNRLGSAPGGDVGVILLLDGVLPVPIEGTRLPDIIGFKQKRRDQLLRFRSVCGEIIAQLGSIARVADGKDVIEQYRLELAVSLRDLTDALEDSRIRCCLSSLSSLIDLKSPTFLAAMGTIASELSTTLAHEVGLPLEMKVSGVVALGVVEMAKHLHDRQLGRRQAERDSRVGYLYLAKKAGIIA